VGVRNENRPYTVSISFRKHHQPRLASELAIGNLDDLLIFSFGLDDATSHFVEVGLEEILHDHELCEDIVSGKSFQKLPPGRLNIL
jgi:hypothetical protein